MKVGIIALIRQGFKVNYYTNKEIWNWCFKDYMEPNGEVVSDLLTIDLSPYQPRKARTDPLISDDVREARKVANKDTTVIVAGQREIRHQLQRLFIPRQSPVRNPFEDNPRYNSYR